MSKGPSFTTLEEAFSGFRRNALSDFTPPKIMKAIEGGFYAGAQSALTLLAEALDLNPTTCHEDVLKIFAECQTFFELQRISTLEKQASEQRQKQEKRNG